LNLLLSKSIDHPLGQLEEVLLCVITTGDPGLICHHDQKVPEVLCRSTKLKDAILELKRLTTMYIPPLKIDHTIAV
jgi:hypothetical protein